MSCQTPVRRSLAILYKQLFYMIFILKQKTNTYWEVDRFISETMQQFCLSVLLPTIDARIEELIGK